MKSREVATIYDQKIREKYNCEYEKKRWFSDKTKEAGFIMTRDTILYFLPKLKYDTFLEIGPGPGTWTKFFIQKYPEACYDLVDVSNEMLTLAKKNLATTAHINFHHSGFLEFIPQREYDILFSSRAIEYITDKESLAKQLSSALKKGGVGLVITKNPHKIKSRFRKKPGKLHQFQISPKEFKQIVSKNGLSVLSITPVTIHFPIIRIPFIDKVLFSLFGKREINTISSFFSESYCIYFKKV